MKTLIEQKREEDWLYKYYGNHDVTSIREKLESYPEEVWYLNKTRQQSPPFVHKETTSLFVSSLPEWEIGDPFDPKLVFYDAELWELIKPIVEVYENMHDGKFARVIFLRLPEEKVVYQHNDDGDYLALIHRHHIAIKTNESALFLIDQDKKHLKVGDCWEINNARLHGAINGGDTERIHLLFDIMPNKYIK
jgi:hypothetical protein